MRCLVGGGGDNSSNSISGCGSAVTASEAAMAGMELNPVATRRFQSLMKSSNCAPTGALFITMADQREALCFACPAAQSKSSIFIESAVYIYVEALQQHSMRYHNKINDVVSKRTLETLYATMWKAWAKGGEF
jgi:hypothetical protein